MKLVSITKSDREGKKLKALFSDPKKTVHFGQEGSKTYIDHNDDAKKSAYLARHEPNETWSDPTTAGSLSRYILWNKKTLKASINDFKSKFNL